MLLKTAVKNSKKDKSVPINIKMSPAEKKAIAQMAKKYAGGNISLWIRYCGQKCVPFKADLVH